MATIHSTRHTHHKNVLRIKNYKNLIRLFYTVSGRYSILVVGVTVCFLHQAVSIGMQAVTVRASVSMAVGEWVSVGEFLVFDPALVCVFVELGEKEPEENGMEPDPVHEPSGIVTVDEEQLERMSEDHYELNLKTDTLAYLELNI